MSASSLSLSLSPSPSPSLLPSLPPFLCDVGLHEDNSSAVDIDTRPSNASKAPSEDLDAEAMLGQGLNTFMICVLDA